MHLHTILKMLPNEMHDVNRALDCIWCDETNRVQHPVG